MASAKYTKLPTNDSNDEVKFDFSSAFTFEKRGNRPENYKSVFTYGIKDELNSSGIKREKLAEIKRSSSDRFTWLLVYLGYLIFYIMAFPIMVWFSFKRVKEGERMVVFRLGHMQKAKGPGLALVFPFLDRFHKKDVSLRAFSVPPKQIITRDKAIIEVGAEIYFQIVDVEKSVTNVQDLDQSTRVLVQTALCNLLSQRNLTDIESERRVVADLLMEKSNSACSTWGVQITRAELSQIKILSQPLPKQAPTVMMPPGLFDAFIGGGATNGAQAGASTSSSGLPAAFAHLASSLTSNQGQNQTKAITQALHAMVAPHLNPSREDNVTTYTDLTNTISPPETSDKENHVVSAEQAYVCEMDPENIMGMIREALCEEVVTKVQETYQFEISGIGEGSYFLNLFDEAGYIMKGPDPSGNPSATLSLTFSDLQAMLQGQLQPYQAYMCGRLRVAGDTAAALKLDVLGARIKALQQHDVAANSQSQHGLSQ